MACRLSAIGALAAIGLMIAGCGASHDPTILNTEKVERAIEQSIAAQRNQRAAVSCPSGVHQKKGLVFSCTATVKGGSAHFVVTELDNGGQVRYVAR